MSSRPSGPPLFAVDAARAIARGLGAAQRAMAPPPIPLLEMVAGHWRVHALGAVARLGIADLLASGPRTVTELARDAGAHEDSLLRVLHALADEGLLAEPTPGTFALTSFLAPLRRDHPQSMRHTVIQITSAWSQRAWADLEGTLRDGEPAFARVFGQDLWHYFDEHPAEGAHFHRSMRELTRLDVPLVVAAHDFGAYRSVVDVGGGGAQLLAGVLQAFPNLRGVVYDLEASLAEAPSTLREAGVEARATVVAGSFFDAVPEGHDAYLLRQILHGLTERELSQVLRNVRAAMRPGARIILLETMVPEAGDRGAHPSFLDLQMLVGSGGRERTRAQYAALLEAHGMRLLEATRTASPTALYVGEARAP